MLMYQRQESEYYRAKMKAARQICKGWVKPKDLPSNSEIRDEIQNLARMFEGESRQHHLQEMRLEALRMMLILEKYRPRLIGSVFSKEHAVKLDSDEVMRRRLPRYKTIQMHQIGDTPMIF